MKKYIVTEWGVLLDFDVNEDSLPIVKSNAGEYQVLSFNYNQKELFDSESLAWSNYYDRKDIELGLEEENLLRAQNRIESLKLELEQLKKKF